MMPVSKVMVKILILVLLVGIPTANPSANQSDQIRVSQNQAVMDFPGSVTFELNVTANAPIQLINLRYGTNGRACEPVISFQNMKFSPQPSLALAWRWKLENQNLYLPPGAQIWWQWLIHTTDENSLLTDRQVMTVEDPDHNWQSLESSQLHLEWYAGDPDFGQTLQAIAQQSITRLSSETGLQMAEPIRLLIYPDLSAIRSATLDLPEWTGGVAFPEYNTILAAIAPDQADWASSVIPHEIAHLLIVERTFNCLGSSLPLWVIEGFSKYAEGPLDEEQRTALLLNLSNAELPELPSLTDQFPSEADRASQAYLVSLAAVQYLLEVGGSQSFSRLLDQVQAGGDFDQALLKLYGFQVTTLDLAWQAKLGNRDPLASLPSADAGAAGTDPDRQPGRESGADISFLPKIDWEISPGVLLPGLLILTAIMILFWWRAQRARK